MMAMEAMMAWNTVGRPVGAAGWGWGGCEGQALCFANFPCWPLPLSSTGSHISRHPSRPFRACPGVPLPPCLTFVLRLVLFTAVVLGEADDVVEVPAGRRGKAAHEGAVLQSSGSHRQRVGWGGKEAQA